MPTSMTTKIDAALFRDRRRRARHSIRGIATMFSQYLIAIAIAAALLLFLWQRDRIEPPAGPDELGDQLTTGAAVGDVNLCAASLRRGAPVDARSRTGCTALIFASQSGDLKLARKLIDTGADVAAASDEGLTPLAAAAMEGRTEVMKLLLDAGARVDQRGFRLGSALHSAAAENQRDAARLLLANHADVNFRDRHGFTPLMTLAYVGDADPGFASDLLAAGADATLTNDEGNSAYTIAVSESRADLMLLFARPGTTPLQRTEP